VESSEINIGDLVRVKTYDGRYKGGEQIWHEFMGKVGVIIAEAMRLHIPAFKIMIDGELIEFDHDEVEVADA
jgi:hypothetical protein